MKVILDCNIWISFLMGYQREFLRLLLKNRSIEIYICDEIASEVMDVAQRAKCKTKISNIVLDWLDTIFEKICHKAKITAVASCEIRDPKDLYLISFSESIHADYLITGDKDLLVIKEFHETKMITLAEFRQILNS